MDSDSDQVFARCKRRFKRARSERQMWEPLLDDCIRIGLPGSKQFNQDTEGEDLASEVYDDTGAVALQEYASRLESGAVPQGSKWVELASGADIPEADRQSVDRDLEEINDHLFDRIWESNFASEIHPALMNAGISTGAMIVETSPFALIHNTALPFTQTYFGEDPWGQLTTLFREREECLEDLPSLFPNADFSAEMEREINDEADKPVRIVEHIWTDIAASGDETTHKMTWLDRGLKSEPFERRKWTGVGSSPFIGFRMGRAAGEVWGRGPFLTALPSMRTLNQVFELLLQSASLHLVGMFHVDDDSDINPDTIRIEPGAVLPRRAGSAGLSRIETGTTDVRIADVFQQIEGSKIKRALFNDMLSDPNKTPATATEVVERLSDLAHRFAAQFGRFHYEAIRAYVHRIIWLAEKAGEIEMPTYQGRKLKIKAVSPLAKAIEQREIQNAMQYHTLVAALLGPHVATGQYNPPELLAYLRDRMSQHEKNFVPFQQMQQAAAGLAAMQAGGLNAGGAEVGPIQ